MFDYTKRSLSACRLHDIRLNRQGQMIKFRKRNRMKSIAGYYWSQKIKNTSLGKWMYADV